MGSSRWVGSCTLSISWSFAKTFNMNKKTIVTVSPFLITIVNIILALVFGRLIGKWAFVPIILIEWVLFLYFVLHFAGKDSIKKWLQPSSQNFGWKALAVLMGLITLPLFLLHFETLSIWSIWLPWILLATINPWIEEFYYRGLLLDTISHWKNWQAILFTSAVFAMNHAVFGINSEVTSGYTIIISTFIMGVVWALVYKKTNSLRWAIFAHFLVDFFSLSAPAFLDLFEKGSW